MQHWQWNFFAGNDFSIKVSTKYSFDAYIFGVTATPYDAYKFATGQAIKHPLGFDMKLREPLDFYAVTDHGFYMGMIENYADTSSKMSKNEWTIPMHNLNRPENVTVESTGQRADLFSSVVRQAIVIPHPWWHPNYIGAWLTNNIQLALKSFDYDVHKSNKYTIHKLRTSYKVLFCEKVIS